MSNKSTQKMASTRSRKTSKRTSTQDTIKSLHERINALESKINTLQDENDLLKKDIKEYEAIVTGYEIGIQNLLNYLSQRTRIFLSKRRTISKVKSFFGLPNE